MNYTIRTSRTKKRGFTLTEIAIVLGIVGLILGAIWVAAAAVYNNLRTAHANTEVLQIAQAVRALYATSNMIGAGAAADQTPALITAGVTPKDLGTVAPLINPWPNGNTAVWSNAVGDGFEIIMTGVPQSACINLLVSVGGATADPGLYDATAIASAAPAAGDAAASGPRIAGVTPVLAAAAIANSMGGCTNPLNKVRLGFSLKS